MSKAEVTLQLPADQAQPLFFFLCVALVVLLNPDICLPVSQVLFF